MKCNTGLKWVDLFQANAGYFVNTFLYSRMQMKIEIRENISQKNSLLQAVMHTQNSMQKQVMTNCNEKNQENVHTTKSSVI